jgi:hypothetical protein
MFPPVAPSRSCPGAHSPSGFAIGAHIPHRGYISKIDIFDLKY